MKKVNLCSSCVLVEATVTATAAPFLDVEDEFVATAATAAAAATTAVGADARTHLPPTPGSSGSSGRSNAGSGSSDGSGGGGGGGGGSSAGLGGDWASRLGAGFESFLVRCVCFFSLCFSADACPLLMLMARVRHFFFLCPPLFINFYI